MSTKNRPIPRFVDVNQLIQEVLPCFARGTIYNMVSAREIPFIKLGGRLVFDVDAIANWMRGEAETVIESSFDPENPPFE